MHLIALSKKFLHCSLLLVLVSCSNGEVKQNIDESYTTSGMERFFLPELPAWANYSTAGRCYKSSSFQYLDFPKISANYQLNYEEMIEFQAQYNSRREDYFRTTAQRFLKPVEEAAFFANSLEQVRGGIKQFKAPAVAEVDIVWLEGFIQKNKLDELKIIMNSGEGNERLPILFSSCMSRQNLIQWVQENQLGDVGFYLLSAEWLSPFGSDNKLHAGLRLEVLKLLKPGTKFNLVIPKNMIVPIELTL